MQDVFISYSSRNAAEAEALRSVLTDAGIPVWMAPDSIPAGTRYMQAIVDAIDGCGAMVVVASDEAQASEQVEREVNLMISDYPKKLLCALITDGNPLKGWMRLVLQNRQIETAEQICAGDRGTDRLLASLKKLYHAEPSGSGAQAAPPAAAQDSAGGSSVRIPPHFTGMHADFVIVDGVLERYTGSGGIVRIPHGTTQIAQLVFARRTDITEICFPVTLTEIGRRAFSGCTGLTEVKLPPNLAVLSEEAFADCCLLRSVRFIKTPAVIGSGAFRGCKSLTYAEFPMAFAVKCDTGGVSIGEGVFQDTPLAAQNHKYLRYFK